MELVMNEEGSVEKSKQNQGVVRRHSTFYDAETTAMYPNPFEGYRISECAEGLKLSDDGSLTVTIRHGEPEDKSNWLPAKVSQFLQTLRIYWLEQDTIEGKWTPSPVKRIG